MGNNETHEYPFGEYKFNDNIDEKNGSTFGDYKYNDNIDGNMIKEMKK